MQKCSALQDLAQLGNGTVVYRVLRRIKLLRRPRYIKTLSRVKGRVMASRVDVWCGSNVQRTLVLAERVQKYFGYTSTLHADCLRIASVPPQDVHVVRMFCNGFLLGAQWQEKTLVDQTW